MENIEYRIEQKHINRDDWFVDHSLHVFKDRNLAHARMKQIRRSKEIDKNWQLTSWYDYRLILCCSWWNEGHHLYSGGTVLRLNICIFGSCHFYFDVDDGKPRSTNRLW